LRDTSTSTATVTIETFIGRGSPEGELHEIGLLFANYVFRARKHSVVYLGQSLPYDELLLAYEIHQPDYIFSVFTSEPNADAIQVYLNNMVKDMPNSQLLLTGYQVLQKEVNVPTEIHILRDFQSLIDLANNCDLAKTLV
jgi:hypothetical protein